jgi:hypothetical protein
MKFYNKKKMQTFQLLFASFFIFQMSVFVQLVKLPSTVGVEVCWSVRIGAKKAANSFNNQP